MLTYVFWTACEAQFDSGFMYFFQNIVPFSKLILKGNLGVLRIIHYLIPSRLKFLSAPNTTKTSIHIVNLIYF